MVRMPGRADRLDERAGDLGPGGVAAGVRDTAAVVAAFAGERYLVAARRGVEAGAGADQPVDGVRAPR